MSELKNKLVESLELCISDFEEFGALPSSIMEKDYCMLRSLQSDCENQKYISFMIVNYFVPKYGGLK